MDFYQVAMDVFYMVYPGVAVAAVLWVLVKLLKAYKVSKMQSLYPVAGEYLTSFSKEVDGKNVVEYAPVRLYQKGLEITGSSALGEKERILEGKISKKGYIYGIYKSNSNYENGVGNFFLKIYNEKEEMIGIWTESDAQTHFLASGEYRFMKKWNFSIQKLDLKNYYKGVDLIDSQLGKNYIKLDDLNKMNAEKNYLCFEATKAGEFVGVAIGIVLNVEETLALLKLKNVDIPKSAFASERVGVIKAVVVDERYQGHGIGSALVDKLTDAFEKLDIHAITCAAWKREDEENLASIMKKLDFRLIKEIPDYWKQESEKDYFVCPVCKAPPCKCQANAYFKTI